MLNEKKEELLKQGLSVYNLLDRYAGFSAGAAYYESDAESL